MINIKHLMDASDPADGERLWIEPVGLCKDLQEWCAAKHSLPQIAPPKKLWEWFDEHPDGYDYFRAKYHEHLSKPSCRELLLKLAAAGTRGNFTLLHQGEQPDKNTATALYEYLSELQAYVK